ncbi:MAG: ATP synthase F1 subunit epsilon [Bdellovibrionales bacterium]
MLRLSVVTPMKKIVTDVEVEEVFVPAYVGELNILDGHAPLVTTLSTGILKYRLKGSSKLLAAAISWGYCEVSNNVVNVLAETAETPEEVERDRATSSEKKALENLSRTDIEPKDIQKYGNKLARAQARLQLVKEYTN